MKHIGGDGAPLHLPISGLGLSEEFSKLAVANGYTTLAEFQQLSIHELLKLEWFTAPMFREVSALLKTLHKLVAP